MSSAAGRAKRWCFTLNNPTEEDKGHWLGTPADGPQIKLGSVQYLIFQEERGESGTLHWQGFLILKERQTLAWMKRNFSHKAHWEVTRATNEQARDYCRKEETYTGGLRHEYGELPERAPVKKRDERLQEAAEELDLVKEGYKRPRDIPSMTLMQCGFIPAYKELTADILGPYRPELKIITMVGPPASGKSFCIQKHFPNHGRCICGNNGVWFQNPLADVMVFEEFCGQIMLQRMLQLLDPYPIALEVKGSMRPAMYTLVIITSNTPPNLWYKGEDVGAPGKRTHSLLALWDRIGYACGGYVPARGAGHYLEAPDGMPLDELRKWFDRQVQTIVLGHEPISDDELPGEDDDLMAIADDIALQEERRQIGYGDH